MAADEERAGRAGPSGSLDFSDRGLKEIPEEVFAVRDLHSLNLRGNEITALPDRIAGLDKLTYVNLTNNPIERFPEPLLRLPRLNGLDLAETKITRLPDEIGAVRTLQAIWLRDVPLEALPDSLADLPNLTHFFLSQARIEGFPAVLLRCRSLSYLSLAGLPIREIPAEIRHLGNLKNLAVFYCGLTSLPDVFDALPQLETLELGNNDLQALPRSMARLSLTKLDLQHNPLQIPPEILAAPPGELLAYYFSHLDAAAASRPLNEAKMVLVGEGSVGKTSLVRRLLDQGFDANERKTEGIRITPWEPGTKRAPLRLRVWDFGGQEIMHATHQFFLTRRSLYLVVLDSRAGEVQGRLEYWLKITQSFAGDAPVIIVCNKADQQRLALDERGLTQKYPGIHGFHAVSCETGDGIAQLRKSILQEIRTLPHLGDRFLPSWIAVKDRLEATQGDYMSFEAYDRICREAGVTDATSQKTLIRFLHDLGVVLSFVDDPRLMETSVLNPEWVTAGVYRILNTRLEDGVLRHADLATILDPARYPAARHQFIIDMMKKFELCFEFDDRPSPAGAPEPAYLIPDLLPKNEPDTGDWDDALRFQYHYAILPSSVVARFIVRMQAFISKRTYWRNGVVLAREGCRALVKADPEDRRIHVSVSGPQAELRRALLDTIRAQFEGIHASISQLGVQERVPLPDEPGVSADYRHLLRQLELRRVDYVPEGSDRVYVIRELLGMIESEARREARIRPEASHPAAQAEGRPELPLVPPPLPVWHVGGFLLLAFVAIAAVLGGIAWLTGSAAFAAVAVASILVLALLGLLLLRLTGVISEANLMSGLNTLLGKLGMIGGGRSEPGTSKPSRAAKANSERAARLMGRVTERSFPTGTVPEGPRRHVLRPACAQESGEGLTRSGLEFLRPVGDGVAGRGHVLAGAGHRVAGGQECGAADHGQHGEHGCDLPGHWLVPSLLIR